MAVYDPFVRGRFPVGVKTSSWTDEVRDRSLPVEIWYPATAEDAGRDLDPDTQDAITSDWSEGAIRQAAVRNATPESFEAAQLIVFCHGFAGFRHEATFLTTHLASHGYVVVAADHINSTFQDLETFYASRENGGGPPSITTLLPRLVEDRMGDVPFLVSAAAAALGIDVATVGISGVSLGGWTALMAPAVDRRVAASVPLCPAGGENSRRRRDEDVLIESLNLADHAVPTLMLVGDRDSWLPLYGQIQIFRRLGAPVQLVVLEGADHNHFVDDVEQGHDWLREYTLELASRYPEEAWGYVAESMSPIEDLMSGELANRLCRGATVAHFDAAIRGDVRAKSFLAGLQGELNRREMPATVLARPAAPTVAGSVQ